MGWFVVIGIGVLVLATLVDGGSGSSGTWDTKAPDQSDWADW